MNKLKKPIFIVGHSRSGSTLLASLLNSHTSIAALPETHFFGASYSRGLFTRLLEFFVFRKKIDTFFDKNLRLRDIGISKFEFERKLQIVKPYTMEELFSEFLLQNLEKSNKQRILEKTPKHLDFVEKILNWYPDAKVICTIRDGRDAVSSLVKVPWTHNNIPRHAAHWAWCVRRAKKLEKKYPKNFLLIKYEDLLENSYMTINRVCIFIEEEFEENIFLLERTGIVPEWEQSWKIESTKKIDTRKAFNWKKNPDQMDISFMQFFMKKELESMGYDILNGCTSVSLLDRVLWGRKMFSFLYALECFIRIFFFPKRMSKHSIKKKVN